MAPTAGVSQTVRGVVTKADTTIRLVGAEILFRSSKGTRVTQTRTGLVGEFQITLPAPGTYLLEAHAIGYAPRSLIVQPAVGDSITVRIQLDPMPVQLAPVTVYGLTPREREFASRRHLKYNFSYDWTQFAGLGAQSVKDVIQFGLPGGGFPFCKKPQVYLDGKPSRTFGEDGLEIPLDWVYGIEMYRSFYDIPLNYRDLLGDRRCGAILIWTHPVGWKPPPDSARRR
jgi:hypothetical protein